MTEFTVAATRCGMPAIVLSPMAHGLVPFVAAAAKRSGAASYQASVTRNDAQGGASAWSPPV
ncbi:MAG TPA: hypothetical protein VFJ17_01470 [Mycobacteriales bacterium]|nr:hypothetical protein [Mycobacteriales bacterium]